MFSWSFWAEVLQTSNQSWTKNKDKLMRFCLFPSNPNKLLFRNTKFTPGFLTDSVQDQFSTRFKAPTESVRTDNLSVKLSRSSESVQTYWNNRKRCGHTRTRGHEAVLSSNSLTSLIKTKTLNNNSELNLVNLVTQTRKSQSCSEAEEDFHYNEQINQREKLSDLIKVWSK